MNRRQAQAFLTHAYRICCLRHTAPVRAETHRKGSLNTQAGPDAAPRWIGRDPERPPVGGGGRRQGPGSVFTPAVPGPGRWEAFRRIVPTHLPCLTPSIPTCPLPFASFSSWLSLLPVTPLSPPRHFSFCTFSSSFLVSGEPGAESRAFATYF